MAKWRNPSGTREYYAWRSMRNRCSNQHHAAWKNYGGRGVSVCDRWLHDYDAFFEDMGPCPDGYSLDRIDTLKGYEPANCRWTDWHTQLNNRRVNVRLTHNGKTQTLSQWARELGLRADTLFKRLKRLPVDQALTSENLTEKKASKLVHGTRVGYERFKCRCVECRAANAKRHLEYVHKRSQSGGPLNAAT